FGQADAMIGGYFGKYEKHYRRIADIIPVREGVRNASALHLLILPERTLFFTDTQISRELSPEALAELAILSADEVRRFGIEPKAALLSYSDFGSADMPSARNAREALRIIEK